VLWEAEQLMDIWTRSEMFSVGSRTINGYLD